MPLFMLLTGEQDIPGLQTDVHTHVRNVARISEEGRRLENNGLRKTNRLMRS